MQKQSISEEELWSVLKEARKTNPEVKKNYKNTQEVSMLKNKVIANIHFQVH